MNKVGGLIVTTSMSLIGLGVIIGGVLVNEVNERSANKSTRIWRDMALLFKDELMTSWEENDKLKRELKERA